MSESIDQVAVRLNLFTGQVYNACGMGVWCFGMDGHMYYTTCPSEQEFLMLFNLGGCMDYALNQACTYDKPFVMSDTIGLEWVGEYFETDQQRLLVILGPVFYSDISIKNIEASLRSMNLSVLIQNNCITSSAKGSCYLYAYDESVCPNAALYDSS